MTALAGLAILHGCVAAAFIEALLRVWHVRRPDTRLALRAVALLAPFVSVPMAAVWPWRHTTAFLDSWSLFAGPSWDVLHVGPFPTSVAATVVLSGLGLVLFARDTVPYLADRLRRAPADAPAKASHGGYLRLASALRALRQPPPALELHLVETPAPVLLCSGWDRTRLTVSEGTLERLDDPALVAAITHEVEHARHRDPALGWVLMAVRTLQAFNPATQIVGRQCVDDIEYRADWAVARLGLAEDLARAVAALSAGSPPARSDLSEPGPEGPWRHWVDHAADRAAADRCARILDAGRTPPVATPGPAYVPLAAAALAVLLVCLA